MQFNLLALLAANWLIPLLLVAAVAVQRGGSRLEALPLVVVTGAYLAYLWRASPIWPWIGNYWPAVFLTLYGAALVAIAVRMRDLPWITPSASRTGAVVTVALLAVLVIAELAYFASARRVSDAAIELAFPLRGGPYQIVQGGNIRLLNHHLQNSAQRYALDIVALNDRGLRASGLKPAAADQYAIYKVPVLAPCAGEVIGVRDGLPDRFGPLDDAALAAGNYVSIFCGSVTVVLAHLAPNSISVVPGALVTVGEPIARVGSSGSSSEPHLHIHAVAGRVTDHLAQISSARGVPMRFNHQFLIRNDLIEI
jgi:hypothetical protein